MRRSAHEEFSFVNLLPYRMHEGLASSTGARTNCLMTMEKLDVRSLVSNG